MTDTHDWQSLMVRLERLEAVDAIRRITSEYFRICDTLGPQTEWATLETLFARNAVWEGRGRYQEAFGRHEGRAAIVAMLASYAEPPHFALNAHYLSTENIAVTSPAAATGRWSMLQVSTYRDGRSDLRSAALTLDFVYENGAWLIARFVTQNIFARDVAPWNDESPISVPKASPSSQTEEQA